MVKMHVRWGVKMDRIIDLCYELTEYDPKYFSKMYYIPWGFSFATIGDYTLITALNGSHTIMWKIRVNRSDIGLKFQYPCCYSLNDARSKKLKLDRIDAKYNKNYLDIISSFNDVFETSYRCVKYSDLSRFFEQEDMDYLKISSKRYEGIYNLELIRAAILPDDLDYINLCLTGLVQPLRLNYQYGVFDVHCVIAPITIEPDGYLRV